MQSDCAPEFEFSIRPRRRLLLRVLGLLAIAFWGCGTSSAWATCGDYVTIGSPQQQHSPGSWDGTPKEFESAPRGHSTPAAPCRGAECQHRHLPVAPVPVPVTVTPPHELGVLPDVPHFQRDQVAGWRASYGDSSSPNHLGLRVERPPR